MTVRSLAVLALAACAAAAAVTDAGARVVPGKGIAGVALGMSPAKVRAVLGKPARIVNGKNDFGPYREYRYRRLVVGFQGLDTVTQVSTTRTGERTAAGVGVGSTWAQLRAHLRGRKCEGTPALGHCYVGRFVAGAAVTDFYVDRGKVSRVIVGRVID